MTDFRGSEARDLARNDSVDQEAKVDKIKFGTDGWRAVIAEDFTFANVRRVSEAIAQYVCEESDPAKGLVVGYDTRFLSAEFAQACE